MVVAGYVIMVQMQLLHTGVDVQRGNADADVVVVEVLMAGMVVCALFDNGKEALLGDSDAALTGSSQ